MRDRAEAIRRDGFRGDSYGGDGLTGVWTCEDCDARWRAGCDECLIIDVPDTRLA